MAPVGYCTGSVQLGLGENAIGHNSGEETYQRDRNTEVKLNAGDVQVSGHTRNLRIGCNDGIRVTTCARTKQSPTH